MINSFEETGFHPGDPVRSTIETLYTIESRARVDSHEADHIRAAIHELTEFANRRDRGRFDLNSLRRPASPA